MQEKGSVEGLKNKLYSRSNKGESHDVRAPLTTTQNDTPVAWADSKTSFEREPEKFDTSVPRKRVGFAAKFLIGAVVFFVVAAGAAAYFFFGGGNFISPQNIDLQIVAPALVDAGSQANFQYIITNRNSSQLQLVDLVITYPDGTRNPKDASQPLPTERQSIGSIAPGQQLKRTSNALLYGAEGSIQTIHAELEYSLAGSNAVFVKDTEGTITIGSAPVSVVVDSPTEVTAGEPFDTTITVRSNAQEALQNVIVQAQYPFGFAVGNTSPKAEAGGSFWRLGTMAPGATATLVVRGTIDGQDGDSKVMKFLVGSDSDPTNTKVKTPFLSTPATLTVHRPFITGAIVLNGQGGKTVAVAPGAPVQGSINWQSNLTDTISNVEITLSLSGPMLDKNSVQAGTGFYQSADNSIQWTSQQDPTLAQVAPGGKGSLQFSFGTLPPGTGGSLYSNPTVTLNLTVKGTRYGSLGVPEEVSSVASTQVSLASAIAISAQALHFSGPYSNSGPMPPRAESKTQYTVQWNIKNSSNEIANPIVTAVLPTYVDFVAGQSGITYDTSTRTVRWTVGDIKGGVGYGTVAPKIVNFQVALTPSVTQVGQSPALTGAAQLVGTDRFAQTQVTATAEPPTTKTLSESQFNQGMGLVQSK
jgi:hypothetical protein